MNAPDFTEARYRELMAISKIRYNTIPFTEYNNFDGSLLLRHDLDFSVHRAVKMAKIEADLGIVSTYFVHPHSKFYSILEDDIVKKIWEIEDLGHRFGLHFDQSFYIETGTPVSFQYEKNLVESALGIKLDAISTHMTSLLQDPGVCINDQTILGMVNTNSEFIKKHYRYCSDSFSTWRFRSFYEMLVDPEIASLQALIHPEWWTRWALSTTGKIYRCTAGRANSCNTYIKAIFDTWEERNRGD